MDEQANQRSDEPSLASVEGDLFGVLFGFHQRIITRLRQSNLDERKLKLASKRIKQLIEGVTAEMKGTKDLNLRDRLESIDEEVQRLVDDLSSLQEGVEDG